MLSRTTNPRSGARAAFRGILAAGMLAVPAAAHAQSFTPPKACQYGATGSEGDDPVVLVADQDHKQWLTRFGLGVVGQNPIQWGVIISPFVGGINGYAIYTTYTPFLTSDIYVRDPSSFPSYSVVLPQPGVTSGRPTEVYSSWTVTFTDKSGQSPVPYAFVDFIPDYVGSSPLTIQADSAGKITLFCVQENFQGYNFTIYDQNHNYLYDGSFLVVKQGLTGEAVQSGAAGPFESTSRPHPDEPE